MCSQPVYWWVLVSHILVFCLLVFVLCGHCCRCVWIVHSWLYLKTFLIARVPPFRHPGTYWEALWIWVALETLVPIKLKVNFIPVLHSFYRKFIYWPFTYLICIRSVLRHVNQTFLFISGILELVQRLLANSSHVWLPKWKKKDISCCSLLNIVFVNVFEASCTWLIDFPFLNFIIL